MDAINGYSSTSKRRKLMDFLPEVPASEGSQQFPRFLRQYQPTDVPRRQARPKRSVGSPQSRSRSDSQTPEVLTTSVDIAGYIALASFVKCRTHTRVVFVPRLLFAGDETRLLIIRHTS